MELDDSSRKDLIEAFIELQNDAETYLHKLNTQWEEEHIHSLFRAIHNIKGNAGIMGLTTIVEFTHCIEETAGALRQKRYPLSKPIGEALLLALDRLHDLHFQELYGKKFDYLHIDELRVLYQTMAEAQVDEADEIATQILRTFGAGAITTDITTPTTNTECEPGVIQWEVLADQEKKLKSDLDFFRELALQVDNLHENWSGRSTQLFDWAMQMNQIAGNPIDQLQFAAAIYLHDFGMALMPESLLQKKMALNPSETGALIQHPDLGYQYLKRIPGWEEAATIILQHHECINGSGYPNGLGTETIHSGAKILAILDTFFFHTKGKVDSSARKSTVRAVSIINTRVDTDFEGLWVQCFNHMIRKELKAGNI